MSLKIVRSAVSIRCLTALMMMGGLVAVSSTAHGQNIPAPRPLASLKNVPVPMPSNLDDFVKNREAAIMLGKALFWICR